MSNRQQDVCHTREQCHQLYANLNADTKAAAINLLRTEVWEKMPTDEVAMAKRMLVQHGPDDWIHHILDEYYASLPEEEKHYAVMSPHFGWGMNVRNFLRKQGFGEEQLCVHNLDDVYVQLLTDALEGK